MMETLGYMWAQAELEAYGEKEISPETIEKLQRLRRLPIALLILGGLLMPAVSGTAHASEVTGDGIEYTDSDNTGSDVSLPPISDGVQYSLEKSDFESADKEDFEATNTKDPNSRRVPFLGLLMRLGRRTEKTDKPEVTSQDRVQLGGGETTAESTATPILPRSVTSVSPTARAAESEPEITLPSLGDGTLNRSTAAEDSSEQIEPAVIPDKMQQILARNKASVAHPPAKAESSENSAPAARNNRSVGNKLPQSIIEVRKLRSQLDQSPPVEEPEASVTLPSLGSDPVSSKTADSDSIQTELPKSVVAPESLRSTPKSEESPDESLAAPEPPNTETKVSDTSSVVERSETEVVLPKSVMSRDEVQERVATSRSLGQRSVSIIASSNSQPGLPAGVVKAEDVVRPDNTVRENQPGLLARVLGSGRTPKPEATDGTLDVTNISSENCADFTVCDITQVKYNDLTADNFTYLSLRKLAYLGFLPSGVVSDLSGVPPAELDYFLRQYRRPEIRALMAAIRSGEGTYDELGYWRGFGGNMVWDLRKHPNTVWDGISSAFGVAQYMPKTWERARLALRFKDIAPLAQDLGFLYLIEVKREMSLEAFTPDQFETYINVLAYEWASLPCGLPGEEEMSCYNYDGSLRADNPNGRPQPAHTMAQLRAAFDEAMRKPPVFAEAGIWTQREQQALIAFQKQYNLPTTGKLDERTKRVLFNGKS